MPSSFSPPSPVSSDIWNHRYEREIKELKAELAMHDTLTNKSHVQYETYTETQKNDLNAALRKYLAEEIDDIEVPLFSSPILSFLLLL